MGNIYINLKKLVFNTGQIEGVPRNPREWTKEQRRELPKYEYPDNVVTSAFVARLSRYGIDFSVSRAESVGIDALDAQKEQGRAIYGKGYLVSERAAAERAAAERAAAIRFALSPREREIVAQLGKAGNDE